MNGSFFSEGHVYYWDRSREGGTLILSCIHRFGTFFGLKLLNLNILEVFRTMNILGFFQNNEYFWGSSQNSAIFRGHFYAFLGLFLRSRYRMGDVLRLLKFQIFFGGGLKFFFFPSLFFGGEW